MPESSFDPHGYHPRQRKVGRSIRAEQASGYRLTCSSWSAIQHRLASQEWKLDLPDCGVALESVSGCQGRKEVIVDFLHDMADLYPRTSRCWVLGCTSRSSIGSRVSSGRSIFHLLQQASIPRHHGVLNGPPYGCGGTAMIWIRRLGRVKPALRVWHSLCRVVVAQHPVPSLT